jgi:hypothetical protein
VIDLLKIAQHGKGENVYLVRFHYVRPRRKPPAPRASTGRPSPPSGTAGRRSAGQRRR